MPVFRDAYIHAGQAVDLGPIVTSLRDSTVTTIGPSGGTASDSQNLVQVVVPPGALSTSIPIVITPHKTRAEVPLRLPDSTVTTYAMTLEPEGTHFAMPVTVRVANWRNLPTTSSIPVGFAQTSDATWRNVGNATWDGSEFAFQVSHFSGFDVNYGDPYLVLLVTYGSGRDPSNSSLGCGLGSSVGFANGTLRQTVSLPTYQQMGETYGVTLGYDSLLTAGPVAATGTGDAGASGQSGYAAVPQSGGVAASRGGTVTSSCASRAEADQAVSASKNACIAGSCGAGGTVVGGGLPPRLLQTTSWNGGPTNQQNIVVPSGALDVELVPSGNIQLGTNGKMASAGFARRHTEISGAPIAGSGACVNSGGPFQAAGSGPANFQTNQDPGPLVTVDEDVFINQTQTSPSGAGWGMREVGRLYVSNSSDLAVVVHGNSDRETFSPRAALTQLPSQTLSRNNYALALD